MIIIQFNSLLFMCIEREHTLVFRAPFDSVLSENITCVQDLSLLCIEREHNMGSGPPFDSVLSENITCVQGLPLIPY
jgi:hypothetical protein